MATGLAKQRDGCDFCTWAPLSPSQCEEIRVALGASNVRVEFSVMYLANMIVARYDDETYSAIRVLAGRAELDRDWVVMALAQAPRLPIRHGYEVQFVDYSGEGVPCQ